MIEVQLFKNGELNRIEYYRRGVHAVPDEHGWISILDDDGLVLGMHHKDHVIAVLIKAGETNGDQRTGPGVDSSSESHTRTK